MKELFSINEKMQIKVKLTLTWELGYSGNAWFVGNDVRHDSG
jgi:hypothetical protein